MNTLRTLVPPIKCQGIKTKLVPWIKAIVPSELPGQWIEPFMGSGVVAFNVRPRHAILCDSNPHLIRFYQAIADGEITPTRTKEFLEKEGAILLKSEGEHFYAVRSRFNETGDPIDFLFLNRACFNGMIRFNRKRGFNVPFCRKPNRFAQAYITKIYNQIKAVADVCEVSDLQFICRSYEETIASPRIPKSSGLTTPSTRGGVARKCPRPASTATQKLGRNALEARFGVGTPPADSSPTSIGLNQSDGTRRQAPMVSGGECSAHQWPMFLSDGVS